MNKFIIKSAGTFKGMLLVMRPHMYLGWTSKFLIFSYNTLQLSKWISKQDRTHILNDFYTRKRDHSKRFSLYENVVSKFNLQDEEVTYLEFGVFGGESFNWWRTHNLQAGSAFYGFDTFEGLPEDWGTFKKGQMFAEIPEVDDSRAQFVKGLFQESVPEFLKQTTIDPAKRMILHFDADLFSSTLYALTAMAPYMKKGDIFFFDEFNVPNHEFYAFRIFCDAYYIKPELIGAVNNYYQVAFILK